MRSPRCLYATEMFGTGIAALPRSRLLPCSPTIRLVRSRPYFSKRRSLPVYSSWESFETKRRDLHVAHQKAFWTAAKSVPTIIVRLLAAVFISVVLSLSARFNPWGCRKTCSSVNSSGCYVSVPFLSRWSPVSSSGRPESRHGGASIVATRQGHCSIPLASATLSKLDADEQRKFVEWVEGVRVDALARGVSPATIERALSGLQPLPQVMQRETKQPEKTLALQAYVDRTVTEFTVRRGLESYHTHEALLARVEDRFGVPPSVLVALWGVESSFGRNCGTFDSIQALLTLAYRCKQASRAAYFRRELLAALDLMEAGVRPGGGPGRLQGSWAGALGQCQFMPSSYAAYAVQMEGEGKADIWTSPADVFSSMANYLVHHGWKRGQMTMAQVVLKREPNMSPRHVGGGKAAWMAVEEWSRKYGVTGHDLPPDMNATLVAPEGLRGKAYLVGSNFHALLRYNNSISYAVTVATLAGEMEGRLEAEAVAGQITD